MSFPNRLQESKYEVAEFGVGGAHGALSKFLAGVTKRFGRPVNYGTCQFKDDWGSSCC